MDQFFIDNPQYANPRAKNKKIYDNWQDIASKINAEFEGEYNGFHATITFTTKEFTIQTSRQLQSTAGSILPKIAEITTFTYITKKIPPSASIINVRPKSILNQILSLGNIRCQNISFSNQYLIQSNNILTCKRLLNHPQIKTALKNKTLQKLIVIPKKGRLQMTYNKVFNTPKNINELILFLEKVDCLL